MTRVAAWESMWRQGMPTLETLSFFPALLAGLLSFFSPCCLPLYPSFLVFITGISADEISAGTPIKLGRRVMRHSIPFILGFSSVFVILGGLATLLRSYLIKNIRWFEIFGGVMIIVFGLHFIGIFKLRFLARERRIRFKKPLGPSGSLLFGMAFGGGWIPCVSPMMAGVLALAAVEQTPVEGMAVLGAYSLGLALPFFLSGLILFKFFDHLKHNARFFKVMSLCSGIFLIAIGILLLTGFFSSLSASLVHQH